VAPRWLDIADFVAGLSLCRSMTSRHPIRVNMLAPDYGGSSSVIRQALRNLAADRTRQDALRSLLAEWDAEEGPTDEADIAAMADRYGL